MRKIEACLYVNPDDRAVLERLIADGKTPQKIVKRSLIVLLSGRGFGTAAIEREARVAKPTVWRWQEAYMAGGTDRLLKDRGKAPNAGRAVVLCVDEKSQIQALDRTQPGLPLKKGRAGTMTHDYKRNGTTTLFAALDVKTGEVIGECQPRHRASEFLSFLRKIDRTVAKSFDVHAICDNYRTHKTEEVQRWLAKHPRFKLHFTPTSSSWINLVERFFAEITRQRIRRGVFKSVADLEAAIEAWIAERNAKSKPFKWTAKADAILEKNARARQALRSLSAVSNE